MGNPRYGSNYGWLVPVAAPGLRYLAPGGPLAPLAPGATPFVRGRFSVENVDAVGQRASAVQMAEGFLEEEGLGLLRNGVGVAAFFTAAKAAEYVTNVWLVSNISNPYAGYSAAGFGLNCAVDPTVSRPFRHVGIDPPPPGAPGVGTTVCGTGGTTVGNEKWGYTIPKGTDLVNLNSNSIPFSATRDGYVFSRLFGTGPGLVSTAPLAHGGVRLLYPDLTPTASPVGQSALSYELPGREPRLRRYELRSRDFHVDPPGPASGTPGVHQQRPPKKWEREKKRLFSLVHGALRVGMTVHQVLSCMVANTKSWRHYHHAGYAYSSFKAGSSRGKSLLDMYNYVSDNIDNLDMAGFAACVAQRQVASIATSTMGRYLTPDLRRSTNGGWWIPKVHTSPPSSQGPEVVEGTRKRRSHRMR